MGLSGFLDRLGKRNLPLVLHPDAYLERKLILPNGLEVQLPAPKDADFRREDIEVIEEIGPSMLVDDMILISGEVARTTDFEKGFPIHYARRDKAWGPDPLIMGPVCHHQCAEQGVSRYYRLWTFRYYQHYLSRSDFDGSEQSVCGDGWISPHRGSI